MRFRLPARPIRGDRIVASDIEPAYLARLREVAEVEGLDNVETRRIDIRKDLANLGTFLRSLLQHVP